MPEPATLTAAQRADILRLRGQDVIYADASSLTILRVSDLLAAYDALRARVAEVERERDEARRIAEAASARLCEAADTCPVCASVRGHRVDCGCERCDRKVLVEERRALVAWGREAQARAEALAGALDRYGRHEARCVRSADPRADCTCGLDACLAPRGAGAAAPEPPRCPPAGGARGTVGLGRWVHDESRGRTRGEGA